MKKTIAFLLAFLMLFSFASCAGEGDITTESETDAPAPDHTHEDSDELEKYAAPIFTVYDKDGNKVSLSDMKGMPVVVNFWASWCPPCKAELPDFDETAKEYEGKVVFMMVNLTDGIQETEEEAKAFIKSMGYEFPVYFDKDQDAAYKYSVSSIPATCFIDKDGYFIASATGMIDKATLEKGISMIYTEVNDK